MSVKVLVIEDDQWELDLIRKELETAGMEVREATTHSEVISIIRADELKNYKAILWDNSIPGDNDEDFAVFSTGGKIVWARKLAPETLFVAMSGDPIARQCQIQNGCDIACTKAEAANIVIATLKAKMEEN